MLTETRDTQEHNNHILWIFKPAHQRWKREKHENITCDSAWVEFCDQYDQWDSCSKNVPSVCVCVCSYI